MEERGAYRAFDACLNRAMEGIRVCEDILRFAARSRLSASFKEMRHDLREASSAVNRFMFLEARDVAADGQKFYDIDSETKRAGLIELFTANISRAAESLRSLEELSKLPSFAGAGLSSARFEELRFRIYSLQRESGFALVRGGLAQKLNEAIVVSITSRDIDSSGLSLIASTAVKAGVPALLYKAELPRKEAFAEASVTSDEMRKSGLSLLFGSRPELAAMTGSAGVVLGDDDYPLKGMLTVLPPGLLRGVRVGKNGCQSSDECKLVDFMVVPYGSHGECDGGEVPLLLDCSGIPLSDLKDDKKKKHGRVIAWENRPDFPDELIACAAEFEKIKTGVC